MPIVYAVNHAMSKPLITVDVDTLAHEAIKLMVEKNIGAVVVTEKGEPAGIITERDILKKCCIYLETVSELPPSCIRVQVGEIMSKPLVTVDGDTPTGKASEIMTEKNIRRLLVTEKEKIVGIVTQKDLMRATLEVSHALSSD